MRIGSALPSVLRASLFFPIMNSATPRMEISSAVSGWVSPSLPL